MLQTALVLPAPDVEALIQGRTILAMPRIFINPGRAFSLYPADASINSLPPERYYSSNFLPVAQTSISQPCDQPVAIKAWARCELCQIVESSESLDADALSRLTVWTPEALQETLAQRQRIFLAYLRVYRLSQPVEVPVNPNSQKMIGKFVPLRPTLRETESAPALSDSEFTNRRVRLEKREVPAHPELEELQAELAQIALTNPAAKQLNEELQIFLGWRGEVPVSQPDADLDWIKTIAEVGNSSDGQSFEKLVRRSFLKLGFSNSNRKPEASLNPNATGGAGGLDFYCETPYSVVGECKASKNESVPNSVSAQLIHLGHTHLGAEQFDRSIKIIVAAGSLTIYAENAAVGNQINVMRPRTLQRLVELKAKHPGAVNLLELKPYLLQTPFGEGADTEVNLYIDSVWEKLKLRSHIISLVKDFSDRTNGQSVGFSQLHGVYVYSNPPQPLLSREQLRDILIEISSPLTGYLGRVRASDWESDRFYFLRELPVGG
nr:DUF1802 family protein [Oscillatoria sp. PCC 10802]